MVGVDRSPGGVLEFESHVKVVGTSEEGMRSSVPKAFRFSSRFVARILQLSIHPRMRIYPLSRLRSSRHVDETFLIETEMRRITIKGETDKTRRSHNSGGGF